jgi:hypothetical protein
LIKTKLLGTFVFAFGLEFAPLSISADVVHNPDIQPNGFVIPNLPAFYARCFSRLIKSVRQWRKQFGSTGYLHFIRDLVL